MTMTMTMTMTTTTTTRAHVWVGWFLILGGVCLWNGCHGFSNVCVRSVVGVPGAVPLGLREKTRDDVDVNVNVNVDVNDGRNVDDTERRWLDSEGRRSFLTKIPTAAAVAVANPSVASAAATATGTNVNANVNTNVNTNEQYWPLGKVAFSLLPLAGTSTPRATVEEEIVPGTMWTHDQIQGVVNVNVPVRQVVIKLSEKAGGGLWVHNPVAPTPELLRMMRSLERKHGKVRHIVLGTVALEHKATFGPFAANFPYATVWVQPGQWSFPLNLPLEFLGVVQRGRRLREIPLPNGAPPTIALYKNNAAIEGETKKEPEWTADIDFEVLEPLKFKSVGAFSETAFFHRSTKTLVVTDTVLSVPKDPPAILRKDPRALLFHARDAIDSPVQDDEATRARGWRRMVQFGLVFFPSQITVVPAIQALRESFEVDAKTRHLGEGAVPLGLYPWTWKEGDVDLRNAEAFRTTTLLCPPILTKLILDREPVKTLAWVDRVCRRFDFTRVLPSHLANDVQATPREFSEAFDALRYDVRTSNKRPGPGPLPEDLALLQKASDLLTDFGVVAPSQICDGEPARTVGRFARVAATSVAK